jgi:hypothetical protein
VSEKESLLIAEAETDEHGNFSFELGDGERYSGEAFEIDVYCGNVPRGLKPRNEPPPPVQFSITTLQPMWRRTQDGAVAFFEYCVPARYWCAVLRRRRLWVICGRLTTCERPQLPIAGAEVEAFDADWLQDDSLGTATTHADGRFHIYYTRPDFEETLFSWINFELVGGPDVYFVVKFAGTPILTEGQAAGRAPGRSNAGTCLCVELCTDNRPHTPPEKLPHWTKVAGRFNVQDDLLTPADNFLPEGYAGSPAEAYVFGGGVMLNGNDNSSPVALVNVAQLLSNACSPIMSGPTASIDIRYTVDHPHLSYFKMKIRNNATDPVHDSPTWPGGSFTAGSFFFRGGASGPADPPNQPGGVPLDISGDPPCAYTLELFFHTRHYLSGQGERDVLYCIE